ncbi:hypothetical protein [Streptomyces sp. CL12-4]|uniref:hypothetical protein n=1 Tax=Streptomyces sp. CL12-4 TaxID=2810306 RepID=UPI001EFABBBA|nr:hypothetical protein [Streptomyces sp. CL12-4]MCG8971744.1 hypothetical protein [Streptomyces sp. CL12-4]
MATNTTKKPAAAAAAEESTEPVTEPTPARSARTPAPASEAVVGPALPVGVAPVKVRLSHHLGIGGADYPPGAEILVSPDYARRLRGQGYATQV